MICALNRLALRKKYYQLLTIGIIVSMCGMCGSCMASDPIKEDISADQSSNYRNGKFHNAVPRMSMSLGKSLNILSRFLFENREDAYPSQPIPVETLSINSLASLPNDTTSVIRIGHSTILFKINEEYWLTDPIFSERASPFQFMGPKRFHKPPITIDELPNIKGVIISHNHYDHLDEQSIKKLKDKVDHFYVSLGNQVKLQAWGIDRQRVSELDWWQSINTDNVTLTATSSQHFSGRGFTDGNESLWSSWVIATENSRIFFSGDTGYFPGFKAIGNKYGPFDLTIMETGGYNQYWPDVHMLPEQSLQAHIDLGGKLLLPVHNSTFDLAFHPWFDPLERVTTLGEKQGETIVTPIIGQAIVLGNSDSIANATNLPWWENIK